MFVYGYFCNKASVEYYVKIARLLEQGRFELLFFADRLAIADRYGGDKTVGLRYGDQDATRLDPRPFSVRWPPRRGTLDWGPPVQQPMNNPIILPTHSARSIICRRAGRHGMS